MQPRYIYEWTYICRLGCERLATRLLWFFDLAFSSLAAILVVFVLVIGALALIVQIVLVVIVVIVILIIWQVANHLSISIIVVEVEVAVVIGVVVQEWAIIDCAETIEVLPSKIVGIHEQRRVHVIEGELRGVVAELLTHVARRLLVVVGVERSSELVLLIRVQVGHERAVRGHYDDEGSV